VIDARLKTAEASMSNVLPATVHRCSIRFAVTQAAGETSLSIVQSEFTQTSLSVVP